MKLSEVKKHLEGVEKLEFILPTGVPVPEHFHVTEVGLIDKHFIDCGGTVRKERNVSFQLWSADDVDHRLRPQKLLDIIALSEKIIGIDDLEIEIEYQSDTIGKYGLDFNGTAFELVSKTTSCLAIDQCSPSAAKKRVSLKELVTPVQNACKPGSGCC